MKIKKCECGCNKIVKKNNRFILGHNCIGRHLSKKNREKISAALKGKKLTESVKKKISLALQGKNNPRHSEKTKQKISLAAQKRTGKNAGNWLGGISKLPYAFDFNKELKILIRKRDKRTCQLCHKRKRANYDLPIHHIDYNKQNSAPKNLITLCRSCNSRVNANRKTWTKIFKQKLK